MASSKKPKYPVETPEESKISLTELANNPESRTPIIVCVDCSYSMLQNEPSAQDDGGSRTLSPGTGERSDRGRFG